MARQRPWTEERLHKLRGMIIKGLTNRQIAEADGVSPEAISWAIKKYVHENATPSKDNHGMTKTSTYRVWWGMICRCKHPVTHGYALYGGRGIKVCDRWLKFENFLEDMGVKPDGMSLGRRDNDKDYEPGNCRWETNHTQQRNRSNNVSVEWEGVQWTQADLCAHLGIKSTHIPRNMARGMTRIEAIQHLIKLKEKRDAKIKPSETAIPS